MSRAKKDFANTAAGHKSDLIKTLQSLAHRHDLWRVFSDFVEMAAVSIANACDRLNRDRDAREARYIEIIKAYTREEMEVFPQMLGQLTMALEFGMDDVLGKVFMELDLGSNWRGQFFTPYEICQLTARIGIGNAAKQIEEQGFISINEPTCGGGAMIIAAADELQRDGINYQRHLHAVCQDLDIKAVHMAYIQLSLLHVPAIVIHGNSLALEERSHWCTPAHVMGGWDWKLRRPAKTKDSGPCEPAQPAASLPTPSPAAWQQAGLF